MVGDRPDWADEDKPLALVRSGTPRSVDGCKPGEPTGMVVCEDCWRCARNWDWIDHAPGCVFHD
jgi:hypothetical protein